MIRKLAVSCALLGLAACGDPLTGLTDEQRAIKPSCVAGDFGACSDIGHQMADARRQLDASGG